MVWVTPSHEPLTCVLLPSNSSIPFLLHSLRHLVTVSRPIGNSMFLPPIKIILIQWLLILYLFYPPSSFFPFPHLPFHLNPVSIVTNSLLVTRLLSYPVRTCYWPCHTGASRRSPPAFCSGLCRPSCCECGVSVCRLARIGILLTSATAKVRNRRSDGVPSGWRCRPARRRSSFRVFSQRSRIYME
jgi:hypothetical protein